MTTEIRSIRDLNLENRRVLVRVDFNVPLTNQVNQGQAPAVADDYRIRASLPTLQYILEKNGKPILMTHLGRPKGVPTPSMSVEPAGLRLAELLGREVILCDDCVGDGVRKVIGDMRDGQVVLLENLRFHPGETANDPVFAKDLATWGDVYINDAFGAAHRSHASITGVPKIMTERGAGLLLESELKALGTLRTQAKQPYIAVLGGAKVSEKITLIDVLLQQVNALVIGGAMANTFLAAQGFHMGASRVEDDKLALARSILKKADDLGVTVLLPKDMCVGASLDATTGRVVKVGELQPADIALDIGPETVAAYRQRLMRAASVFWNGPMGLFENPAFASGTEQIARILADCQAFVVVGGGDSMAAVNQLNLSAKYAHVSTGGGASLEYLEGRKLPGVEALYSEHTEQTQSPAATAPAQHT